MHTYICGVLIVFLTVSASLFAFAQLKHEMEWMRRYGKVDSESLSDHMISDCECVGVCACVHACVCACVRACVCVHMYKSPTLMLLHIFSQLTCIVRTYVLAHTLGRLTC